MRGTLYGIGVGPGDPELMTLKGSKMSESLSGTGDSAERKRTLYGLSDCCAGSS